MVKKQRGGDGKWFNYRGRAFDRESDAMEYAREFANQQRNVPGTKIVVYRRNGSVVGSYELASGEEPRWRPAHGLAAIRDHSGR